MGGQVSSEGRAKVRINSWLRGTGKKIIFIEDYLPLYMQDYLRLWLILVLMLMGGEQETKPAYGA